MKYGRATTTDLHAKSNMHHQTNRNTNERLYKLK